MEEIELNRTGTIRVDYTGFDRLGKPGHGGTIEHQGRRYVIGGIRALARGEPYQLQMRRIG